MITGASFFGLSSLISSFNNISLYTYYKLKFSEVNKVLEQIYRIVFLIIYSNALDKKVKHFSECFNVEAYSFCRKPRTKKLKDLLQELKYNESEVVIIGDQILTDVLLGNTVGITTILTTPISKKELIFTRMMNQLSAIQSDAPIDS